jgi:hypothetical protein
MSDIAQSTFINPYDSIGTLYTTGLGTIVAELAASPSLSVDDLISDVPDFLQEQFYPSGTPPLDQQIQLSAIVGNIFNAYVGPANPVWSFFTSRQQRFIRQFIADIKGISTNQNSGDNYFQLIQESIATSDMTTMEQVPLLMALSIASEAYDFFYAEILSPDANWSAFIDSNPAVNFSNLANWTIAAFRGTLIGYQQSVRVVPSNAPQATGVAFNMVTAVGGALTLTFGEIVYNWVPRPKL